MHVKFMYTQFDGLTKILIFYGSPRGACEQCVVKNVYIPRISCNEPKTLFTYK